MDSTRRMKVTLLLLLIIMVLGSNGLKLSSTSGRSLLQTSNDTASIGHGDDTVRVDPLDKFRRYRGGFDITNKHYWSSTVFTGVYGYGIGLLWLVSGLLYASFLLATTFFFKTSSKRKLKKRSLGHSQSYLFPLLLATLLTLLTLVASGIAIGGSAKFHREAKKVVNIIIETANDASETMRNATAAMTSMRINLEASNGSVEASLFLSSTSQRLNAEAAEIETQATRNRRLIDKGLEIVYIVTSVIVSFTVFAAVFMSIVGVLRLPRALNSLIVLCWFLTILCWFLFGVYFFLERLSSDTCTALESFKENSDNNSLSSILPCRELLSAKPMLSQISSGIYNLVNEVNANISVLNPRLVGVCNPFSAPPEYQYQPQSCPHNSIRIGDIPQALKILSYSDGGLISTTELEAVEAYSSSIQELLNAYPSMEDLVECKSVKDGFGKILEKHCEPLRRQVRLGWEGMVFLSVVMVVLVLTWTVKAQLEQQHQFSDGSVKPHSVTATVMESGMRKETQNQDLYMFV